MTKLKKVVFKKATMEVPNGTNEDGSLKDKEVPFNYKEHIINALNQPPTDSRSGQPRGFGPEEMRRRMKILDKVNSAETEVLLEKSEYGELKTCVNDVKWMLMNQTILDFIDSIEKAEEVEVEEKK